MSLTDDLGVVDKQVLSSTVGSYETVTFPVIEPLDSSSFQRYSSLGPSCVLQPALLFWISFRI